MSSAVTRVVVGVVASSLFLYLALRNVSYVDIRNALAGADMKYVVLALLSVAANIMAKAIRWKLLLGHVGRRLTLPSILRALLVGQMLNLLVPVRIGDASRAYTLGAVEPGRVFVLATVALEKFFDVLAYVLLFVFLPLLVPLPGWITASAHLAGVSAVALFAVSLTLFVRWRGLPGWFERRAIGFPDRVRALAVRHVRSVATSLRILQDPPNLLKLTCWSAVIWGTALLNNHLVLLALRIHLPLAASLLLLVVLQAGISIPSAPAGIGIFEYLCVLSLAVFNVEQGVALSYGVLLHVVVMLPPMMAGLLLLPGLSLTRQQPDSSSSAV